MADWFWIFIHSYEYDSHIYTLKQSIFIYFSFPLKLLWVLLNTYFY